MFPYYSQIVLHTWKCVGVNDVTSRLFIVWRSLIYIHAFRQDILIVRKLKTSKSVQVLVDICHYEVFLMLNARCEVFLKKRIVRLQIDSSLSIQCCCQCTRFRASIC